LINQDIDKINLHSETKNLDIIAQESDAIYQNHINIWICIEIRAVKD